MVADLAERYGVRVWAQDVSWPELRDLIHGLLSVPSRLAGAVTPKKGAT